MFAFFHFCSRITPSILIKSEFQFNFHANKKKIFPIRDRFIPKYLLSFGVINVLKLRFNNFFRSYFINYVFETFEIRFLQL